MASRFRFVLPAVGLLVLGQAPSTGLDLRMRTQVRDAAGQLQEVSLSEHAFGTGESVLFQVLSSAAIQVEVLDRVPGQPETVLLPNTTVRPDASAAFWVQWSAPDPGESFHLRFVGVEAAVPSSSRTIVNFRLRDPKHPHDIGFDAVAPGPGEVLDAFVALPASATVKPAAP